MPQPQRACFNVDVDSLYLYYRIHGLDEAKATNAVWERGVARFAQLFDELGVSATFFVVASDLERWPAARKMAEALVEAGHELGSHSYTHPYDLTRKSPDVIAEELDRAAEIIADVRGEPTRGFRAPGYNMTDAVFDQVRATGHTYSSSVFPCPPYYLAKAAVMGLMALRGRKSASILGDPRVMVAPTGPHLHRGVVEIPVTVLPWVRFPVIGTSLLMMGQKGYRAIKPVLQRMPLVNLEFHGIDLCDLERDAIDKTLLKQPDLRHPLPTKLALFREVLGDLAAERPVVTLETLANEAAADLAA